MLLALLRQFGAEPVDLGRVPDDPEALRRRVTEALEVCDVLVSSGGVSMGTADHMKALLESIGTVHFGRLNMKPGKPATFCTVPGTTGDSPKLVFALPGNPVSCLV